MPMGKGMFNKIKKRAATGPKKTGMDFSPTDWYWMLPNEDVTSLPGYRLTYIYKPQIMICKQI